MADFSIQGSVYGSNDPHLQGALAKAHAGKIRPICMCYQPGVPMYIARMGELYVIKRMPDSGGTHSPHCESYEPPPELSGLGEVMGQAIKEDLETGTVALKLDFALNKAPGRAPPAPSGDSSDSVKTDGKKLTLRSLLHYLWDESGMTKWSPKMAGKRSWFVIQKYVVGAAQGKLTKGSEFANSLYVPEPFYFDRKDEIASRREAKFGELQRQDKGGRKLMVLVGEVKEICPGRYGHKIVVKHVPDCHFMLPDDVHKRLKKRFEGELALWEAMEDSHLMAITTFGVGPTGVAGIEEIALMITTENWIPFESVQEKMLIDRLTEQSRHFVKGMRYNMPLDRPLATVVLSDTRPTPTGMYIVGADSSDEEIAAVEELAGNSSLEHWFWRVGVESMPEFPRTTAASETVAAADAKNYR